MTPMSGIGPGPTREIPLPGKAPMVAPNAAALLRRNAGRNPLTQGPFGDPGIATGDPGIATRVHLRFGAQTWTHAEFFEESCRFAHLFLGWRRAADPAGERSFHVAILSDNTPDYLFAFGGAALAGAAIVGLNPTRRGEHLARDLAHTDCLALLVEPQHLALLAGADLGALTGGVYLLDRFSENSVSDDRFSDVDAIGEVAGAAAENGMGHRSLAAALPQQPATDPGLDPPADTIWALIFTSGTSDAPKAVICTQRRFLVTGNRMGMIMDLTGDDTGYLCMPLFHSNALMVGWAPALVNGAGVGLARRFSASRWLADIRHFGSTYFNYVGKPLSYVLGTPERPDDAENPLRVAFGNEGASEVVEAAARRFGVAIIDTYGATEGGIAVNRDGDVPPSALGVPGPGVRVVADDGTELPRARIDAVGRLLNAAQCVGEIVNTSGTGAFEGYYNNREATERLTRRGWYWSGDLGYVDEAGFLYFAGRSAEWIRVDGENFPAGPIEAVVRLHPDVALAAVYGVPDDVAGDQVMACLLLRDDAPPFDPVAFSAWLDAQPSLGPKWRPRYVRVTTAFPSTGTNKVVVRSLQHQKFRADRCGGDPVLVRLRGENVFRPFTVADEARLRIAFEAAGRERFWEL